MKENSTEENIKLLEEFSNENVLYGSMVGMTLEKYKDLQLSTEHILSDYKRVLKENEELKFKERSRIIGEYGDAEIHDVINKTLSNDYISVQKVKDIIDRIDYDIKKTKEIISKNTNIYASYRKNDYQIVRLRAMNTKSLDIKKRLQELIEGKD